MAKKEALKARSPKKRKKTQTKKAAVKQLTSKAVSIKKAGSKISAPRKTTFSVSIVGDEARYFVCIPSKTQLKALKSKGVCTEAGVMTLSDALSGDEESTWISPLSVSAYVSGKSIPIKFLKNKKPLLETDHRGKNIIFVEQTIDRSQFTAQVDAYSVEDIQVEICLSERWVLPNGRRIEIFTLDIVSPSGAELEFQGGGGGYISGELITADGKSVGLDEDEDDDTGEYRVKVSES